MEVLLMAKKYASELIGTFVLVFVGCGSAVFLGAATGVGHLAVALAFGLSIVAMAYVIGNVSGCHINPAVSLAVLLNKKMNVKDFVCYVIAQIIGAIAAAALLQALVSMALPEVVILDNLGANGVANVGIAGAFIIEIVLTFIFVFVILGVVSDNSKANVAGIVIGLTLAFVHIIGIPLTGTSVNPARSIGPAIFAGGNALTDLWVFIIAPLVGATLAAIAYKLLVAKSSDTK